jgi:acyl carrier protein
MSSSQSMEELITTYITHELVNKRGLNLKNDTPLLRPGLLDSFSLIKLVLYLEKQFGVVVPAEELIPDNFMTVNAVCNYLRTKRKP